ncbi:hypothetical protein RBU61_14085 [Tissierella sp. MB52-C2]|jgi:hypothetical protein|uniref:hypothetical protein n=1 Tax=Tissierella sp. MB52-C2 TaxID=3070999 RepID=UPI00280AAA06|nr:hypothetical protein [Tissierella sp. MB52-C2]WMM24044.1 hypothetical protein RBU61_14085 [Tissierella sp. MB52-C2]
MSKVIAGDYKESRFVNSKDGIIIAVSFTKRVLINKDTVESYELVDEEHRTKAMSAIGRGMVGSLALGPVGLLAGLSAKKKGSYLVAVKFKDGKESLLELDDKLYKTLVKTLF